MRINNWRHVPWIVFVLLATIAACVLYAGNFYPASLPSWLRLPRSLIQPPTEHHTVGGTPLGLWFGSISLAIFIFAILLSLRKKIPLWRVGTVQRWLRAHIWLTILTIPLVIGVFYVPEIWLSSRHQNLIATSLFIAAAITDWLDGYLARRLNQTSAFGAFLDPVADKLMIAAALIVLVWLQRVDAIIAVVIIGREIAVSAMREWMAKIGQSKSVAVNFLGKIKTISQMIAVPLLLYYDRIGVLSPQRVGTWLIYVAAILTLVSMFYYLKLALAPRAEGDRRRLDRRGSEP